MFCPQIIPWSGSIEMGVTVCDPETMDLPDCATDLGNGTWVRQCYIGNNITSVLDFVPFSRYIFFKCHLQMMSGNSILKDGLSLVELYGQNLDSLIEGDCLGVMRSSNVCILGVDPIFGIL